MKQHTLKRALQITIIGVFAAIGVVACGGGGGSSGGGPAMQITPPPAPGVAAGDPITPSGVRIGTPAFRSARTTPNEVSRGQAAAGAGSLDNEGNAEVEAEVQFFWSEDTTLSSDDMRAAASQTLTIPPGETAMYTYRATAPPETRVYYLCICIDGVCNYQRVVVVEPPAVVVVEPPARGSAACEAASRRVSSATGSLVQADLNSNLCPAFNEVRNAINEMIRICQVDTNAPLSTIPGFPPLQGISTLGDLLNAFNAPENCGGSGGGSGGGGGGGSSGRITFTLTDRCTQAGALNARFFGYVGTSTAGRHDYRWPAGGNVYTTDNDRTTGESIRVTLDDGGVGIGVICYGAQLRGGRTRWGAGIDGDQGCSDCCTRVPSSGTVRRDEGLTCN